MGIFRRKAKAEEVKSELDRLVYSMIKFGIPIGTISSGKDAIEKGYLYNHIIYTLINKIVNAMDGVPWQVYRKVDEQAEKRYRRSIVAKDTEKAIYYKSMALEPIEGTQLNRLLEEPNKVQRLNDIIRELATYYLITGNGYLYGVRRLGTGDVIQLQVMPSHLVRIEYGTWLNPVKGYRLDTYIDGVIPPDDVVHIRMFNPKYDEQGTQLYGLSPIQAAANMIQLSNYTTSVQLDNYANYGVRGILGGDGERWDKSAVEAVKELWNSFKQAGSRGDIIVTSEPMRFTQVGLSPADMQVIEQQKMTLRDLCMIYNVPPQLLGDSEHSTYNNMREARKALITDAVLPVMEKVKDALIRMLCKDTDLYIDYDMQAFVELSDDLNTMVTALGQAWWLTPNERRVAMGRQPIDLPVMDEVLIPSGYMPVSMVSDDGEMQSQEPVNDEEL